MPKLVKQDLQEDAFSNLENRTLVKVARGRV